MPIIYIFLLLFANTAFAVEAYQPAQMNSSGQLIDGEGRVIAVRNSADKRNSDYEYYYSEVDGKGKAVGESRFRVETNPENPMAGYVKYDLKEATPTSPTQVAAAKQENNNTMVKNYGTTTSYNVENLDKGRYNHDYDLKPLYGE